MKRLRLHRPSPTAVLSLAAVLVLLLLAAVLPGCGGVDSGGTGQTVERPSTASGRISGFGSVIVNGIRYDDSAATIVDDDGVIHPSSDLRLGMVVEVQGRVRGNSGQGTASRIQFGHEIAGPVSTVDAAGSTLVVLGQTVQVDVDTLFEGYAAGLADVLAGQLVAVHGFYDSTTGSTTATRIERRASLGQYTLRGRISGLQGPPTRSFSIGGALIDYGAVAPGSLPTLANGLSVRVSLNTTPVSGRWVATSVHTSQRNFPESNEAELEGFVSGYASTASFLVAGVPVDASGPTVRVRRGTLADLANGVRVEVDGQVVAGVLVASELDFKRGGDQEFELHGPIESVNAGAQTLVLRGVTVAWDGNTNFSAGNTGDLVVGALLDVRGAPSGGVRIQAESIRFER